MKFRFPIVIIDEDFRSENTSGLGIRALAAAMEKEGMEVLGVTSYGDLAQFAQQASEETSHFEEIFIPVTLLYFISAFAINRIAKFIEARVRIPGQAGAK